MASLFASPDRVARALSTPSPTAEQAERLSLYTGVLNRWQRAQRLVGWRSSGPLLEEGVSDAWQAARLCSQAGNGPWVDIGSGAGLPGVVLAVAHPQQVIHLVESRRKRVAFLNAVVRELGLDAVHVHAGRSEDVLESLALEGVGLLCARAVADPPRILDEGLRWGASHVLLHADWAPPGPESPWMIHDRLPGRPAAKREHLLVGRLGAGA